MSNPDTQVTSQEISKVTTKKVNNKFKFIFVLIFLLLLTFPIFEYTSLFRTNHVLEVSFVFDKDSDKKLSDPDDVIHCLYNGGILTLSYENCEKAFVILHHDLGVHKYGLRDNGSYRNYDVMLNFIGDYGWKLQQVTPGGYYFVKSKLRFLPSSF